MMMVYRSAQSGNVGAMKELGRLIEKHDLSLLSQTVSNRAETEKKPKLGKKELQREAASRVSGKFTPPAAPHLIN